MKFSCTQYLGLMMLPLLLSACAAGVTSPSDSDGDGVADVDDRCPATVAAISVDGYGCADSDSDGVIDPVDQCPNTPPENMVDQYGCLDSDNDGIKNGEDQCPRTERGERVMHNGCSARQAVGLESVFFAHGGAEITTEVQERLAGIAELMRHSPNFRIALQGHSDNSGTSDFNYRLSRIRANAVKAALLELGVASSRIDVQAYGDTMPIAENSSSEGRARNRRVALRVIRALP
ncbi:OmpA family protein [Zhongshania sp.]|uniref:OmpA family protein n=1 Tax=Zhongshania sp. TaxID=1971902 RepID=UPI001B726CB7|nr:OmpA family protein [Zhongshania sp.]MBQ0796464.1 OmpA family protein [Zhongshania sp.]